MILTNKKQQNKTFIQIYNPLKDDEKGHCKIYVKEQSIPFQIGWKMKKKKKISLFQQSKVTAKRKRLQQERMVISIRLSLSYLILKEVNSYQ